MAKIPRVEVKKISEAVTPDKFNINKHTQKGGGLLENELRKRGAFRSIASAGKDTEVPVVYAGNFTLEKAVDAGYTEVINVYTDGTQLVNVVRTDIAPESAEAIALGISDNEIGKQSYNPDIDLLAAMSAGDNGVLLKLKEDDKIFGDMLKGMGLKESEPVDAEPQIDRAAELAEKWKTESGQLWKLGEHRLLIGDCTVRENVERLMGGEKAGACVTDSPYGINREGIENDDPEGLRALFDGCLAVMPIDNGVIINFQSPRLFPMWLDAVRDVGQKFERMLWMYKSNDVTFTWRGWLTKSECIVVSSIGKAEWKVPTEYKHDCYSINWDKSTMVDVDGWHASIKPPEIVKNLIDNTVGVLYEPFAGSGTTIIAAHNLNRRCFAMEISEKYGAVILERFFTATGIQPELAE